MSSLGMGMIFTISGKHSGSRVDNNIQSQSRSFIQTTQTTQPQTRTFSPLITSNRGFRTMDLGNLKNGKSCGSCGH